MKKNNQPVLDLTELEAKNRSKIQEIEARAGVSVKDCYQCGKCSAGCTMAHAMDMKPREVMRALQLGRVDDVLQAESLWICSACSICSARCPQKIAVPRVMETALHVAREEGYKTAPKVDKFSKLFLGNVKTFGKSHEMVLMGCYNLITGKFLQDVDSAPALYLNRKIRIRPHMTKNRKQVADIMDRALAMEKVHNFEVHNEIQSKNSQKAGDE